MHEPFHVLWLDDQWADSGTIGDWLANSERRLVNELEVVVDRAIVLSRVSNAAEAAEHLRLGIIDYRVVLLDYRFELAQFDWSSVTRELLARGIAFAVMTNFPTDATRDADFPSDDPLCIGLFAKDEQGLTELIARLRRFLQAPPFRVLHLSDLHYSGVLSDLPDGAGADALEEQEAKFEALEVTLRSLASVRPLDAVMLTGDFAWHNPEQDLRKVRPRVAGIIEATVGLARRERVYIVPGNHDLRWEDFRAKKLGPGAWDPYWDFYQSLFGDRLDIMAETRAWNAERRQFAGDCQKTSLAWYRYNRTLQLDVIGLASPAQVPERQGHGSIERSDLDFIAQRWAHDKPFGTVRMLLIHHNLFGVISLSRHDEDATVNNAGKVLMTLGQHGCTTVLSGHTHVPSFSVLSSACCRVDSLSELGVVSVSSPGTVGGRHGAGDRRAGLNVLEFEGGDAVTGDRYITVQSYAYGTVDRRWSTAGGAFRTRHAVA